MKNLLFVLLLAFCSCKPADEEDHTRSGWEFEQAPGDGLYLSGATAWLQAKVTDNGAVEDNDDWKVCIWRRESDGSTCRFDYVCEGFLCSIGSGDFHVEQECDRALQDVEYIGEDPNLHNRVCGLKIPNMDSLDNSVWTVEVEECFVTGCGGEQGNGKVLRHSSQQTVIKAPSSVVLSSPTLKPGISVRPGTHQVTLTVAGIRPEPMPVWDCSPGMQCSPGTPIVSAGPDNTVNMTSTATVVANSPGNFIIEGGAVLRNTTGDFAIVWEETKQLAFSVTN